MTRNLAANDDTEPKLSNPESEKVNKPITTTSNSSDDKKGKKEVPISTKDDSDNDDWDEWE